MANAMSAESVQIVWQVTIAILGVIGSAVGSGVVVVAVTWRFRDWIDTRFNRAEAEFENVMEKHEVLDQKRHEDNLANFTDVRIQMVALRPLPIQSVKVRNSRPKNHILKSRKRK